MKQTRRLFPALFGLLLFLFTGYLLADTFLIQRTYAVVTDEGAAAVQPATTPQAVEITMEAATATAVPATAEPTATEPVFTETSYADGNISVELSTCRLLNTTVYVADVRLSSPEYLKTALAHSTYGRNVTEKTSDIAASVDAILAVNGDYYGAQRSGYVIRNGVLYRSVSSGGQDLVIYADGSFGTIDEDQVTAESLLENGAWNVLSFGPALVQDGEIAVSEKDEVGRAMASNPRTAIGVMDDLHYVFVVSDGRTSESDGLSLHELAAFMQSLGVKTAYNLDGGGSSSMVFLGNLVNQPVNGRKTSERKVSDIVYIGYSA